MPELLDAVVEKTPAPEASEDLPLQGEFVQIVICILWASVSNHGKPQNLLLMQRKVNFAEQNPRKHP